MIIISWFLLMYLYYKTRKRGSRKKKASVTVIQATTKQPTQAQIDRKAKKAAQIEQAESDVGHYTEQLNTLYKMQRDAIRTRDKAQEEVDTDNELNRYGAVVSFKTMRRHIAERDREEKKLLTINNQIHSAEKQLAKAKRTLYND